MSMLQRVNPFLKRFGLRLPVLLAPLAGVEPTALSQAVMQAGGAGACGALLMQPAAIVAWAEAIRGVGNGIYQINLWVPDPTPRRDPEQELRLRGFLARFGPEPEAHAGDSVPPPFEDQFAALLAARPPIASSVMGLFRPEQVAALRAAGIAWAATVSTLAEARQAEAAGADLLLVQGAEAGGHRAAFAAGAAEHKLVGLFSLLPAVARAVRIPVVATGGIADGAGVAAALLLGASAVQVGTAFLRCPDAGIPSSWAAALATAAPEDAVLTRAFSGRAGRSLATGYVQAMQAADAPQPAPYPVQRGLTAALRADAVRRNDLSGMQAWSGQSAALGRTLPAAELATALWQDALALLQPSS